MKKYKAVLGTLGLIIPLLLAGCGAGDSTSGDVVSGVEQSQNAENGFGPGGNPPFGGDDFDGQMPGGPGFNMDGGFTGEVTYTSPEIGTVEDVFSNRDVNSAPDLTDAVSIIAQDDCIYTIDSEGIYVLTGRANNFTVEVAADKSDKVQIVLQDVTITNDNFPVIYVKKADKCFVTSVGNNLLTVSGEFVSDKADASEGETETKEIHTDAVIFSKEDLTLNGTGSLTVRSAAGNGITSKDDLKIAGGTYDIECAEDAIEANDSIFIKDGSFAITADSDGIQAKGMLVIWGGEYKITALEGMEATYVQINGGVIDINASDDGINAAAKSEDYDVVIEINGGEITVVMGPGDTDGLDANGVIVVNGGTVDVTGNSTFDYDIGAIYNGGTIIVNGTVTDSIPASMMGGGMGGPGGHGGFGGRGDSDGQGGFGGWGDSDGQGGFGGPGDFGDRDGLERPDGRGDFGGQGGAGQPGSR